MSIVQGRMTVDNSEELVVFLIGARVNRWWLLPLALPILATMPRMLAELQKDPESGLLGVQPLGLGGMVQYWKSADHLYRYAQARERRHRPAWMLFMKKLFKNWSAGVWHETFVVRAGQFEAIYVNMPKFGLGTFKPLVAADGALTSAPARLAHGKPTA